jgi:methanethiol S-methyltransferase
MQTRQQGSIGPIVRVFVLFAVSHSLLASQQAKQASARLFGSKLRNGLYRFGYNGIAVLCVVPGAIWFARLPDRTLYRVPKPWSFAFHAVQAASLVMAVAAARVVGLGRITGIEETARLLKGETPPAEPEAQGPPFTRHDDMKVAGPFQFTRHPLNLAPVGVFAFFPHMTVNRATLTVLSIVYLMIGSVHEEARLWGRYGDAYRAYQQSGVPFYWPVRGLRRTTQHEAMSRLKSITEASQRIAD